MIRISDNFKRYLFSLIFGVALGLTFLTILRKIGIPEDSLVNFIWMIIPIWVVNYKDKIFK